MKQVVQNRKTGNLDVLDVPLPVLRAGGILVSNAFSLISPGTERATINTSQKSLLGKARTRPDLVQQVFDNIKREGLRNTLKKVQNRLDTPKALGYSSAGYVVKTDSTVKDIQPGMAVCCAGDGYASHAELICVPRNLCVQVPTRVSLDQAAFAGIGSIALQSIRQADIKIGESVAVIGMGLIGQLVAQLAIQGGCRVLGIDISSWCIERARALGLHLGAIRGKDDIVEAALDLSRGRGVDVVIITAGGKTNDPIELAPKLLRDRGRIIVVGAVNLDIPRKLYYEKEIDLRFSRSYGPGRYDFLYEEKGIDYPVGYVRWTEQRNMEAFLDLIAEGRLYLDDLVTHRYPITDAEKAYRNILAQNKNEQVLAVLLEYPHQSAMDHVIHISSKKHTEKKRRKIRLGLGFIGAGNFAQATLLPALKRRSEIALHGVVTRSGITARNVAAKFGFNYCSSKVEEILKDTEIDTVFIATRHHLHAAFVCDALEQGKHVFTEKPLALSEDELMSVVQCWKQSEGILSVGFNRRFAPISQQIRSWIVRSNEPVAVHYRVNAGRLPKDHWTLDPDEGGGRILGEACHFIDYLHFLTCSDPLEVYACRLSGSRVDLNYEDTVQISMKFQDGSVGSISYFSNGDSSFDKERVEIFSGGEVIVVDDFKRVFQFKDRRRRKLRVRPGKGHREEVDAFLDAILNGKASPIPFHEVVLTTLSTFAVTQSIQEGRPINIKASSFWKQVGEISRD